MIGRFGLAIYSKYRHFSGIISIFTTKFFFFRLFIQVLLTLLHINPSAMTLKHSSGSPTQVAKGKNGILGKILKFAIPLVVSVGLFVVMFRDIDFNEMMAVIRSDCDFRWIALALALSIAPMFFRAMRWRIQLKAIGVTSPLHLLVFSIFGTYAVNLVFPRLGEVWRCGFVAYRRDAQFSAVFGSMVADRFADLLTVLILTLLTFVIAHEPIIDFVRTYPQAYNAILAILTSPFTWIALVAALALAWWLLTHSRNSGILKIKAFLLGLWKGFAALASMQQKGRWLLLTVALWGCYFLQLVIQFNAFPMTQQMLHQHGLLVPLVCFVLTSISMGIPSYGGIGPYQTTMLFGLGLFIPSGMNHTAFLTQGAAFGNLIIAMQTALTILLGLITFAWIALNRRHTTPAH